MSRLILLEIPGNAPSSSSYFPKKTGSETWAKYQRNAVRYLRATGTTEAIETLEYLPFTCETLLTLNAIGDLAPTNKHLMTLRVPVEVFVEIETGQRNWDNRANEQLPKVAHALGRVGCNVWRVIAEGGVEA